MLNYIREYRDKDGSLFPLDLKDIPFIVKRIFFVTNTPIFTTRGKHAHHKCEQVLCCISGNIKIKLNQTTYYLNPGEWIYMPVKTWCEQQYLTGQDVMLVLCSEEYDPDDYIYNKEEIYEN